MPTAPVPALGFLYPGYSAEDDYPRIARMLAPKIRAELIHTEMEVDAHRRDALLNIGSSDHLLNGAKALQGRGVEAAMWACTSGSFVFGWEGARQQAQEIEDLLGVPASSTSFAFVEAVHALGFSRVAIAATYPDDVARSFVEFLGHAGIETVSLGTQGIISAAEVGTLQRDDVLSFVTAGDHPDAEAILVPDTALHTVALIEDLERAAGKPVLTANIVTVREALRLAGRLAPQENLGTLFRLPVAAERFA